MQFKQITGQADAKKQITETMLHGRLPHALLVCGPTGIGKLAFANAIAQYMNCLQPSENDSCGKCSNCMRISQGLHPDVHYILPIFSKTEGGKPQLTDDYLGSFRPHFFTNPYYTFEQWQQEIDADNKQLFIGVHEMREAKRKLLLKSFEAKFKTLIVWNAERMRVEGANAFLKLLEEPPERTLIIMTCSDTTKLLTTINSRCQRIFLNRLSTNDISHYLQNKNISESQANSIAFAADGSIGTANAYLEETGLQINHLYVNWLRAVYTGNYVKIGAEIEKIYKGSKEFQRNFLTLAIRKLRDSLLYHLEMPQLALVLTEEKTFHESFGKLLSPEKVEKMISEIEESSRYILGNANAQMVFVSLSLKLFSILRS